MRFSIRALSPVCISVIYLGTVNWGLRMHRLSVAFLAGGLAYGRVKSSLTATLSSIIGSTTSSLSGSDTKVGWTLGGGIEGPLLRNSRR